MLHSLFSNARRLMTASIHIEQPISAPLPRVWEACASVEGLTRWQADAVSGEVRESGQLVLCYPAFSAEVRLDVLEVIPERRLVLQSDDSLVEIDLKPGLVSLQHTHLGLVSDLEGIESSWRLALAQLAHSVERHPDLPRTVSWVTREARGSAGLFHLCFTERHCLGRWLGEGGDIGPEGARFAIGREGGLQLSGRVCLNVPGHDIALVCENLDDSFLVLRSFPAPGSPEERIVALAWSVWGEHDSTWLLPTIDALESALDDLQGFTRRAGRD